MILISISTGSGIEKAAKAETETKSNTETKTQGWIVKRRIHRNFQGKEKTTFCCYGGLQEIVHFTGQEWWGAAQGETCIRFSQCGSIGGPASETSNA